MTSALPYLYSLIEGPSNGLYIQEMDMDFGWRPSDLAHHGITQSYGTDLPHLASEAVHSSLAQASPDDTGINHTNLLATRQSDSLDRNYNYKQIESSFSNIPDAESTRTLYPNLTSLMAQHYPQSRNDNLDHNHRYDGIEEDMAVDTVSDDYHLKLKAICILQRASTDMLTATINSQSAARDRQLSVAVKTIRACLDDNLGAGSKIEMISGDEPVKEGLLAEDGFLSEAVRGAICTTSTDCSAGLGNDATRRGDILQQQLLAAQATIKTQDQSLKLKDIEFVNSRGEVATLLAQLAETAHDTSATTSSDPMLESLRNEVKTQKEQLEKQKTVIAVLENLNNQLRYHQPNPTNQPKQGKKKKKGGKKAVKQESTGKKGKKRKGRNGKKKAEAAMRQAQITRNQNQKQIQTKRQDSEPVFTPWPWNVNTGSQAQSSGDAADGVGPGSANQMDGAVDRGGDRTVGTGTLEPNRFVEETRRLWEVRVGHTRSGGSRGQAQSQEGGQGEIAESIRPGYDRPPHRLM